MTEKQQSKNITRTVVWRLALALVVFSLVTCKKSPSCEEVYQKLESGQAVELSSVSCDVLACLQAKYEAIIHTNTQKTAAPTLDEQRESQRAYEQIRAILSAKLNNKC